MIEAARILQLNDRPIEDGRYVLYWMQASQRARWNHALEYAIQQANVLDLPAAVAFGLTSSYPEANLRHYAFMLEGLRDVADDLKRRGIEFIVRLGNPPEVAVDLSRHAAMVVCDRGYLRHQKRWRDHVADMARCRVMQVETDVVVPTDEVSDKQEFAARTIRPRIHRLLAEYLHALRATPVRRNAKHRAESDVDPRQTEIVLADMDMDRSVSRSVVFRGGSKAAAKSLRHFIANNLAGYAQQRAEPSIQATSRLSPYLHFGHISPLEIALGVSAAEAPGADRDAFLEELIVRRELAINFVHHNPDYDRYDGLPSWARATLQLHARDPRRHRYSRQQLEASRTHDVYWNAAQREMVLTGFMHNSMRMYWGKKILEWKQTPREAFDDTLYLNNRYFLCGRDPASYANVGWICGLHDRPWTRRSIFGTIRYMNAAGLERKFDMAAYVDWVRGLEASQS